MKDTNPVDVFWRCRVSVDGDEVLMASREWREKHTSTTEVAAFRTNLNADRYTEDEQYVYSGTGAVGKVLKCRPPDTLGAEQLFTVIQTADNTKPDAPAMLRLITAYTEAVAESDVCAGGVQR